MLQQLCLRKITLVARGYLLNYFMQIYVFENVIVLLDALYTGCFIYFLLRSFFRIFAIFR